MVSRSWVLVAVLALSSLAAPALADLLPPEPVEEPAEPPAKEPPPDEVAPADEVTPAQGDAKLDPLDLSEPVPVDDPMGVASTLDDLVWPFIKTMLMLLLVLGLVYLTLNKGLGKLISRSQSGKRITVVERVGLDQRRALFVVRVDGKEMLLGTSEAGIVRLDEMENPSARTFEIPEVDTGKPPPITGVRKSGERVSIAKKPDDESAA